MKRILSLGSAAVVVLAFGLTGCDSGGDMGDGVPKEVKGYVDLDKAVGGKAVSTDPTKIGIKPPKPSTPSGGPPTAK